MKSVQKVALIALASGAVALTGCASKGVQKSSVVVAPTSNTGYVGGGYYDGGALVNNPAAVAEAAQAMNAVVHFDFNSDAIRADAAAILNEHAAFLTTNAGVKVLIAGHTDERGSREYNMSLGERRAAAVRSYLAAQGVNVGAVEIVSYGEEQPVATGSNEEAWAQNRRAELSY